MLAMTLLNSWKVRKQEGSSSLKKLLKCTCIFFSPPQKKKPVVQVLRKHWRTENGHGWVCNGKAGTLVLILKSSDDALIFNITVLENHEKIMNTICILSNYFLCIKRWASFLKIGTYKKEQWRARFCDLAGGVSMCGLSCKPRNNHHRRLR